ncbi:MAG TPA: acetyl ornithine aminotransferase family protein [Candidatus Binatia bacterium]|nr:acetyl ornithine aminotransferase family protein [Candidatus Binatia bacterium]
MKPPHIKTALPGPKAKSIVDRDHRVTAPAYGRVYPLVVKRASGMTVEDVDGNLFLDFMAGIAVASTGHSHPRVVQAIEEQARKFLHICGSDYYYEPMVALAEKLGRLAPGSGAKKVFFTNSGTETIEAAIKLARYHTKRQHIIAFHGAFHGRTLGSLSLTASRASHRAHFGPLIPGVHHVPYPKYDSRAIESLQIIEKVLFRHEVRPEEVAAVFVEPIQGEGGYLVPPAEYLPMLQDLCRKHGILLVVDEIQSGFGRTGKMFASEHWGLEPDIVCAAKGIASGMPLGAMIARAEISTWPPSSHGSTFGGNPVACAAALATIELLEEGLVENAAEMGALLKERLTALGRRHSTIADVRGLGLMVGVEFCRPNDGNAPDRQLRERIMQKCFEKGLLLLGCGESTLRFCPPLIVTAAEVETAVRLFDEAIPEAIGA